MMTKHHPIMRLVAFAVASLLATAMVGGGQARADTAYGVSYQSVLIKVNANAGSVSTANFSSHASDSGTLNGSGPTNTLPATDPPEAFVGQSLGNNAGFTTPPTPHGTVQIGMNPPDYGRGDAQIIGNNDPFSSSGFAAASVAESYIQNSIEGSGDGRWSVSEDFTVSGLASGTSTFLHFNINYNSLLQVVGTDADADYHLDITITNTATGGTAFEVSPLPMNHSFATVGGSQGPLNLLDLDSFNSSNSFGNGTYTIAISGSTSVNVSVPEPSSILMLGVGAAGLAIGSRRFRKTRARASA